MPKSILLDKYHIQGAFRVATAVENISGGSPHYKALGAMTNTR